MASNIPGISTLGALFGYAVETEKGTKPTAFKQLHRINEVGGITITVETIDASALEDVMEASVAGRGSSGGSFPVTVNVTDETLKEWEDLIAEYKVAQEGGKQVWFETYFPALTKGFFVIAEPPSMIPQPQIAQNGLLTVEMTLTINKYIGADTAIKPTDA